MTVIVTGAGSHIAKAIINRLRSENYDVIGTYRSERPGDLDGVKLIPLNLCETIELRKLPRQASAVIHVAAGTPRYSISDILETASKGILSLQNYSLNAGADIFVLTSSVSLHGKIEQKVLDENTPVVEPDIYGVSKLLTERILAKTADFLPVMSMRLPGVTNRLDTDAWIPSLMRSLLRNEEVTIYNSESLFNNAIDIDELAKFTVSAINRKITGFHAFPLASTSPIKIEKVVDILRNAVESKSCIFKSEVPRNSFTISSDYAERHFGYKPISIGKTLLKLIKRIGAAPR